jgi:hypothetical protein
MSEDLLIEELKNMKLHELKRFDGFTVLKVYKGWIYKFREEVISMRTGSSISITAVFVPK